MRVDGSGCGGGWGVWGCGGVVHWIRNTHTHTSHTHTHVYARSTYVKHVIDDRARVSALWVCGLVGG